MPSALGVDSSILQVFREPRTGTTVYAPKETVERYGTVRLMTQPE